jgi:hypothetical protein
MRKSKGDKRKEHKREKKHKKRATDSKERLNALKSKLKTNTPLVPPPTNTQAFTLTRDRAIQLETVSLIKVVANIHTQLQEIADIVKNLTSDATVPLSSRLLKVIKVTSKLVEGSVRHFETHEWISEQAINTGLQGSVYYKGAGEENTRGIDLRDARERELPRVDFTKGVDGTRRERALLKMRKIILKNARETSKLHPPPPEQYLQPSRRTQQYTRAEKESYRAEQQARHQANTGPRAQGGPPHSPSHPGPPPPYPPPALPSPMQVRPAYAGADPSTVQCLHCMQYGHFARTCLGTCNKCNKKHPGGRC